MPTIRNHSPGVLVRVGVVLAASWLCVSAWLYASGLERDYNVYRLGWFAEPQPTPAEIARLLSTQEVETKYADVERDTFLTWEKQWVFFTQGLAPDLYTRTRSSEACSELLARNLGNAALKFTTTCKTSLSLPGLAVFAAFPLFTIFLAILALLWIAREFRCSRSSAANGA